MSYAVQLRQSSRSELVSWISTGLAGSSRELSCAAVRNSCLIQPPDSSVGLPRVEGAKGFVLPESLTDFAYRLSLPPLRTATEPLEEIEP